MQTKSKLATVSGFLSVFTTVLAAHASTQTQDIESKVIAGIVSTQEMRLIYRLENLPEFAHSWLARVVGTYKIAEYGEPWNNLEGFDSDRPYFQMQFALLSPNGDHTLILYKGAVRSYGSQIWQRLLVVNSSYPDDACIYNVHPRLSTTQNLDSMFSPELAIDQIGVENLDEHIAKCEPIEKS